MHYFTLDKESLDNITRKNYNQKSSKPIFLQETDYIALVYCGYSLCQSEKQGKPPFGFILTMLDNFIKDL